jgi:methylmalonyl-CoA carboxyltransferase large subunit
VNVADVLVFLILLVVASVITYVASTRAFRQRVGKLTQDSERQLSALRDAVESLETQLAGLRPAAPPRAPVHAPALPPVVQPQAAPVSRPGPLPKAPAEEVITPEVLVVMAAAVTAFLGKKVRIRSARMLQSPYEIVNPWSQQGRIFVQASHNLRPRG